MRPSAASLTHGTDAAVPHAVPAPPPGRRGTGGAGAAGYAASGSTPEAGVARRRMASDMSAASAHSAPEEYQTTL